MKTTCFAFCTLLALPLCAQDVDSDTLRLRKNIPSTISQLIIRASNGEASEDMNLTYRTLDITEFNTAYNAKNPLTPKDVAEHRINGIFVLVPHNFPADKNYELFSRDIEGRTTPIIRFTAKAKDQLVATQEGKELNLTEYHLFTNDFMPGEPIYYVLLSTDGKSYAGVEIIPNPIETKSPTGYSMKGKLTDRNNKLFSFEATGFAPEEIVTIKSLSENEQKLTKAKADKAGKVVAEASPALKGKKGGEAMLTMTGKKGSITLRYRWGNAAY